MAKKNPDTLNEPDIQEYDICLGDKPREAGAIAAVPAAVSAHEAALVRVEAPAFSREQINLIRDTVARDTTDTEFELFLYTAHRMGLDPLLRQIHAVKRWDSNLQRMAMAVQTGIDGYRLIADRTGKYAPGREPLFVYDEKSGNLHSATAYVKKLVAGTWHEVPATAHYSEYVGRKKDGSPTSMWATKPHIMLAKCAEAIALRRAFPAEMAGVYTHEEMPEAEVRPGNEAGTGTNVTTVSTSPRPAEPSSTTGGKARTRASSTTAKPPVAPHYGGGDIKQEVRDANFADAMSEEHAAAMNLGDVNAPLREFLGKVEAKNEPPRDEAPTVENFDKWLEQNSAMGIVDDLTATQLRLLLAMNCIQEAEKIQAKRFILGGKVKQNAAHNMAERLAQIAAERKYVETDQDLDDAVGVVAKPRAVRKWPKLSGGAR